MEATPKGVPYFIGRAYLAKRMLRANHHFMELAVIEKQALQLSPSDRALLADHLLQSLEDPAVLQSWLSESADRMAAYDRGEIEAREASVVVSDIRSSLSR